MGRFQVSQLRSGEGFLLTRISTLGPEAIPDLMPGLLAGPLLVACEEFETRTPPGATVLEAHLVALAGRSASDFLREHDRWGRRAAIFAVVPALPDEDRSRRCLPHAMRPWDAERLQATVYGQSGQDYAHRGLWFARDEDRRRFLEAAIARVLDQAGVRMPNGDLTLVLDLPVDGTFEAAFRVSGRGDGFRLVRAFPDRGYVRTWRVRRGEWEASDRRIRGAGSGDLRQRVLQSAASVGIIVLSLPVFALMGVAALLARTPPSDRQPRATR